MDLKEKIVSSGRQRFVCHESPSLPSEVALVAVPRSWTAVRLSRHDGRCGDPRRRQCRCANSGIRLPISCVRIQPGQKHTPIKTTDGHVAVGCCCYRCCRCCGCRGCRCCCCSRCDRFLSCPVVVVMVVLVLVCVATVTNALCCRRRRCCCSLTEKTGQSTDHFARMMVRDDKKPKNTTQLRRP